MLSGWVESCQINIASINFGQYNDRNIWEIFAPRTAGQKNLLFSTFFTVYLLDTQNVDIFCPAVSCKLANISANIGHIW